MIRRNTFLRIGGFFEGYGRGYYEDVDLCFSVRYNAEKKVFIDAEATADHVTNASFTKANLPVPMEQNKMLLRGRWGKMMQNDNWSFW